MSTSRRDATTTTSALNSHAVGELVGWFCVERLVVERERALITGATSSEIATSKKPARPGRQVVLNLLAGGARLCQHRWSVIPGRRGWQLQPAIYRLTRGIRGVWLVDHHPDVIREAPGDAFLRRKASYRRRGIAKRHTVLVVPGDVERLAVTFESERPPAFARHDTKAFRRVELVDPVQRRKLQAGPAWIGVELQRTRTDDRVIGDQLRGFEIALDALIVHELDIAEVCESLASNRVARRIDAHLDVDASQIANRVPGTRRSSDVER